MSVVPRLLTRFGDVFYAFDKPAGMAVHPTGTEIPDLVTWIKSQRSLPRTLKPGHRLDRATSGVVLCGSTSKARAQIGDWMREGSCKQYLALVAGVPPEEEGVWNAPLFDLRRKKTLACETRYSTRQTWGKFSHLELELVTGRRHQLRRHLADAGLPMVGDTRYGPKRPARVSGFPGRLWLHAWRLTVEGRVIEAPLPAALEEHLAALQAG